MNAMILLCVLGSFLRSEALVQAEGVAYATLRTQWIDALRASPLLQTELEKQIASASWREAILMEAALLTARRPALTSAFTDLRGLERAHYRQRRRPEAEVGRELQRRQIPGAVLMAFYEKEIGHLPALTGSERRALESAVLLAIGESRHPAAFDFLAATARTGDDARLRIALHALAQTGDVRAAEVVRGHVANAHSRRAAVQAAAQLRSAAGLQIIVDAADTEPLAAARALGVFAAPSAWRAHADSGIGLRATAARELVALLARARTQTQADAAVVALATARHSAADEPLRILTQDVQSSALVRAAALRARRLLAMRENR